MNNNSFRRTLFPFFTITFLLVAIIFFSGSLFSSWSKQESFSKLSGAVFSSEDLKYVYNLERFDETQDLNGICPIDCVKIRYTGEGMILTFTLIQAKDYTEASTILSNLQSGFINQYYMEEFLPSKSDGLKNYLESWGIIHKSPDKLFFHTTVGLLYGNVIILVSNGKQMCFHTNDGLACEGDLSILDYYTSDIVVKQIQKLAIYGY
jgi:hypothetical protein